MYIEQRQSNIRYSLAHPRTFWVYVVNHQLYFQFQRLPKKSRFIFSYGTFENQLNNDRFPL